ncbi:unnamed protein product [Orchesella dallaii]|uniref:Gustatory receptor n=1 Tax=Orchesella dallaii TaxID=48710 RepID=A0ABP1QH16_9HEXA
MLQTHPETLEEQDQRNKPQGVLVYRFVVVPKPVFLPSEEEPPARKEEQDDVDADFVDAPKMGESRDDLESNLVNLLAFGKFIGAYPTQTLLDRVIRIIPCLLSIVAVVDLVGVTVLNPKGRRTATEIAGDFGVPGFYSLGTFLYFHFHRNTHQLTQIFEKWKQLEIKVADARLKRFVNWVSVTILLSAILENATFHFKLFPVFESTESYGNISSLEVFYKRSHSHWALYIPYNPIVTFLLFLTNKWALYIWNFGDVFIAVLARAVYFRFSAILKNPETLGWEKVWYEFRQITEITELIEKFLSPIIFGCYTMNMYAVCMQLHMWLTPSQSKHYLHTLYLAWSFIHLVTRVLLVSITAAKVHEEIKLFERKVQYCPNHKFTQEVNTTRDGGEFVRAKFMSIMSS